MNIERVNGKIKLLYNDALTNLRSYRVFILIAISYLMFFFIVDPHGPNCLCKRTLGIPCPGCGMTRALTRLVTFNFKEAFWFHPLVLYVPIVALVLLFRGVGIFEKLYHSKFFWVFIIASFVITYVIRMILYFPDTEPMTYYYRY